LDVSKNTALANLFIYGNQIKGSDMDALISSLPTNTTSETKLFRVVLLKEETNGNDCTKGQAAAVKAKGWTPQYYDTNEKAWTEYEGREAMVIHIDSENFPDENFRNYLLEQSYGKDAILTEEEIRDIKKLSVSSKKIGSLKGVEFFTALTELYCYNNQLTSLDVSKNTALTHLYCDNNQLTSLDVSKNTALTWLFCERNQLTSLDLSKNLALAYLECRFNQLTSLDVSKNTALTWLSCGCNQLTSLDLSKNIALTQLGCYINLLKTLDVSKNTALTELMFYGNQIKDSDMDALISSLPTNTTGETRTFRVLYLKDDNSGNDCTKQQAAAVKAKGWTPQYYDEVKQAWTEYEGREAKVIHIDSENFPDDNFRNYLLEQSYGMDAILIEEEIKGITFLYVNSKKISSLKGIEYLTALTRLSCYGNQLTSLDVSKNTALTELYCDINQLTSLDVSKNTALTKLNCAANQLTSLDVSKNTALTMLRCYNNQLTSLDVSKNTALTELSCSHNQLSLDVLKNTALATLQLSKNQIKGSAMDALISSLPVNTTSETRHFRVVESKDETGFNECTKEQATAVKSKGWTPQYYDTNERDWMEYEGRDVLTQIESVQLTGQDAPVFSLSGQRLAAPKKGVNIVGGKKVVVW